MILDKQNLLSDDQDLAQAAGSYLSTNTIDLGAAGTPVLGGTALRDPGRGNEVQVLMQVTETFTSGAAGTLQFQLVQADNAALDSNLEVLTETPVLALSTLVAGYQARIRSLPQGVTKRYVGARYVIGTAAMTAGKVTAGVVLDRQSSTV